MSRFDALDAQIIKAISECRRTTMCWRCHDEAMKVATSADTAWRVVDRRQQALRRAGKIRWVKRPGNGAHHWEVCE
jgi:hypothetical protein